MLPRAIITVARRASYQILKKRNISFANYGVSAGNSSNGYPIIPIQRWYSQQADDKMTVDFDYVKQATSNNNVLIVDVREPEEIKEHGKIPNSVNIPLNSVSNVLSEMSDKEFEKVYKRPKPSTNTEMIFYCMIGKRSANAQQNALNLGFKKAKNYLGSWTDWASKTK